MRIAITGDWHLDSVTNGVLRYKDLTDALSSMLSAIENRVDAFVFLGDLCNPDKGVRTLRSITTAGKVARALTTMGINHWWIAGNHDVIDSDEVVTSLSPLGSFTRVIESFEVDLSDPRLMLMFLPYISKMRQDQAELDRWVDNQCSIASTEGRKVVIFGHCTSIQGAMDGTETSHMPRGRVQSFPVEIGKRYGAVMINGHYHTQQVTDDGVIIPGALGRFDFGEEKNRPGFVIVEV